MEAHGALIGALDAPAAAPLPPAGLQVHMGGSPELMDHHAPIMPTIPPPSPAPPLSLAPTHIQGMGTLGHLQPCHQWGT